ncbi:MAG: hypothetical protein K8S27_14065 [Candidatus Omnitrophica bacterium]|nr:hypothetical protein [Candidatus Omnitrophota bacterium]
MKNKIWFKISLYVGFLPLGALFALIVQVANLEIKDLDLWLHLGMGKFIALNHYVPNVDILSVTMAGKEWINHEWLFQLIVYHVFNAWGPNGLLKMQIGLVLITMFILFVIGFNKEKQLMTSFVLLLVYLVFQQRFTVRPDIFSLFFFALYIYILAVHLDRKWSIPALAAVQILWTNIHGFFFFGPLFVLIGIVSQWIREHVRLPFEWNAVGCLTDEEYSRIKKIFLVVAACCLVNPYFIKGAMYPVSILTGIFSGEDAVFFKYIQELEKPLKWNNALSGSSFVYYKLIMMVSFLSFVFNKYKIDISALFLWLVFLFFSLSAMRNTSFFAFAAYLVYVTNAAHITYTDVVPIRFTDDKFRHITSIFVKLLLFVWIFNYSQSLAVRGYYDFEKNSVKSEFGGISLKSFPHKGVDFLVENKIKGNAFNGFNAGAYLIGRCFPDIKVFIDGRTELYGGEFFKKFQRIWADGDTEYLAEVLDKYNITIAFMNSVHFQAPDSVLKHFYSHKDWIPVYFDYDALIFLKDIPENKAVIDAHQLNLEEWRVASTDLIPFGSHIVTPYQQYYRAYSLHSLGFEEAAISEANQAIRIAPDYAEPYHLIGKIYGRQKEYARSGEYLRQAVTLKPSDIKIRTNLVKSYLDQKLYQTAIKECDTVLERWPGDVKILYYKTIAYAKDKKSEEAIDILVNEIKIRNLRPIEIERIADVFKDNDDHRSASYVYEKSYNIAPGNSSNLSLKWAESRISLGDRDKAMEILRSALSQDQDNLDLQGLMNKVKSNSL